MKTSRKWLLAGSVQCGFHLTKIEQFANTPRTNLIVLLQNGGPGMISCKCIDDIWNCLRIIVVSDKRTNAERSTNKLTLFKNQTVNNGVAHSRIGT